MSYNRALVQHILNSLFVTGAGTTSVAGYFRKLNPTTLPYGIALLSPAEGLKVETQLRDIRLDEKAPRVKVDAKFEKIIRENMIDMVVYSEKSNVDSCSIFDRLAPALSQHGKYVIRGYKLRMPACSPEYVHVPYEPVLPAPANTRPPVVRATVRPSATGSMASTSASTSGSTTDTYMSLSRCTASLDAYLPQTFMITPPSPGQTNMCDCGKRFVMAEYAGELYRRLHTTRRRQNSGDAVCHLDDFHNMEAMEGIDEEVQTVLTSVALNAYLPQHLSDAEIIAAQNIMKANEKRAACLDEAAMAAKEQQRARDTAQKEQRWNTMMEDIRTHQANILPLQWMEARKENLIDWLEYIRNPRNPTKSTLRCRLCHENKNNPILNQNKKPNLANDEGAIRVDNENNRHMLHHHMVRSEWHRLLSEDKVTSAKDNLAKSLSVLQRRSWEQLTASQLSTAKTFHTVFAEAKMNVAFRNHPTMTQLLELHGIPAWSHHKSEKAPPTFLRFISRDYQEKLLRHLTSAERPLSLILDTAVDSLGHDHLVLQFQALDADEPAVFFIALSEWVQILQRMGT